MKNRVIKIIYAPTGAVLLEMQSTAVMSFDTQLDAWYKVIKDYDSLKLDNGTGKGIALPKAVLNQCYVSLEETA
jgi:hypothetical protein